jgi:hypothetical protein
VIPGQRIPFPGFFVLIDRHFVSPHFRLHRAFPSNNPG